MRLHPPNDLLTTTRMLLMVSTAKLNLCHTRSLPVTLPPGTVCQAVPGQYWTSRSAMPYCVKIKASVHSA